jgi:FdhE protein
MPIAGHKAAKQLEQRAKYARKIVEKYSSARELLEFYAGIAEFQLRLFQQECNSVTSTAGPLRGAIDVEKVHSYLPDLLSTLERIGTSALQESAELLRSESGTVTLNTFRDYVLGVEGDGSFGWFCARACTQPFAEMVAERREMLPGFGGSVCPLCTGRPQVAVLRPEGDGGKRFLLCSFCLTEWEFRRVLCPVCEETDHQKLPRYTAEGIASTRVEACQTCKFYLKSVDMTVDGNAVPVVDEIATASLDLWAANQGFRKVHPNILGF